MDTNINVTFYRVWWDSGRVSRWHDGCRVAVMERKPSGWDDRGPYYLDPYPGIPMTRDTNAQRQPNAAADELERIADVLTRCVQEYVSEHLKPGSIERDALLQVAETYRNRASAIRVES